MKKCISIVISVLLACTMILPAFAAQSAQAKVDAVYKENAVTITISVPAGTGLATLDTILEYDAEKLELQDVQYGTGDLNNTNSRAKGKVGLYMVWTEDLQDAATLATLTFKVKEDAKDKAVFRFVNPHATDKNDAEIVFDFGDGNEAVVNLPKSSAPDPNEKIPSTAGKTIALSVFAAAAVCAAVAGAVVYAKHKKKAA